MGQDREIGYRPSYEGRGSCLSARRCGRTSAYEEFMKMRELEHFSRAKDGLSQFEADIEKHFDWFFKALQEEKKQALEALSREADRIPPQERNTIDGYVSVSETAMVAAERISYFHTRFQQGLEAQLGGTLCRKLRKSEDPSKLPSLQRNEPDQDHKTEDGSDHGE